MFPLLTLNMFVPGWSGLYPFIDSFIFCFLISDFCLRGIQVQWDRAISITSKRNSEFSL